MAISDNNPERRNLVVLSAAIIIFYLSGAQVTDDTVRLVLINVEVSRPDVLAILIWLMLFWFFFRFWVTHRGAVLRALMTDIGKAHSGKAYIASRYLEYSLNRKIDVLGGVRPSSVDVQSNGNWRFHYYELSDDPSDVDSTGKPNRKKGNGEKFIVSGWAGYLLKIALILRATVRQPELNAVVPPILLFILSIALGIWYEIKPILCAL